MDRFSFFNLVVVGDVLMIQMNIFHRKFRKMLRYTVFFITVGLLIAGKPIVKNYVSIFVFQKLYLYLLFPLISTLKVILIFYLLTKNI